MSGVLFEAPAYRARAIAEDDLGELQRFFEANPEYFLATAGGAPDAGTARREFEDRPPAGWPWSRRWMFRVDDGRGDMAATGEAVADLLSEGVWHIGLFVVATRLHGGGTAARIYSAMEAWMRACGARWLRLGVVAGNARAERFWEKMGYREARRREGVAFGSRVNTVRVMVKPLADAGLAEYLARVSRDRPEAP